MERKIGDTFEHEGKQLKVVENKCGLCDGCFFMRTCNVSLDEKLGFCEPDSRSDNKKVIFVEVQPQQTEKPKELNLCELLRHCPENERFWSPMFGDVKLHNVDHKEKRICVTTKTDSKWWINPDATITIAGVRSPEIMLFPSREQRDWSKVKYEPKKEKFDPHTLNPFDKVIARKDSEDDWHIDFFSCFKLKEIPFCLGGIKCDVIPYNDDTKHLIGTTDDVPEFYKYWED